MLSSVSLFWEWKDFKEVFISNFSQNRVCLKIHMNKWGYWRKAILVKLGVFEKENNWLTAYYCKEMRFSENIRTSIMLQSISVCPEWCQWCSVSLCLSFEQALNPFWYFAYYQGVLLFQKWMGVAGLYSKAFWLEEVMPLQKWLSRDRERFKSSFLKISVVIFMGFVSILLPHTFDLVIETIGK